MIKYTNNIYKGYEKLTTVIPIKMDFEKSAYEMADPVKEFVETLKPTKDVRYDWINAMGAGETYGANSRGDYFPRQELIDHHHTFTKNPAHVFQQHNNKNPEIALGEVVFSYFNPDTDRVELIQSLEKTRLDKHASDWVRDAVNLDQDYNTSMGTRVAYDQCSYCNQKNKTIMDYCDHLKHAMNNWIDGVHVHAINIDPNFFDNSIVRSGADKIARRLSKVAALDVVDADNTIWTDEELTAQPKKYFFMQEPVQPKPYINESTITKISEHIGILDKADLDVMCEYELPEILGTCKNAGVELLPKEFQYLVLTKIGESELANEYYDNNIRFRIPDTISFNPVKIKHSEELLNKIASIIPSKSLAEPFVVYNSLSGQKHSKPQEQIVADDRILKTIAESYSNYLSLEKTADLMSLLASLFITLPEIKENTSNVRKVDRANEQVTSAIKERVAKVPLIPGEYNPVFKSEFLRKTAGIKDTIDSIKENTKKNIENSKDNIKKLKPVGKAFAATAPGLVGAGATAYLAGTDAKRELENDPRAGTGLPAFARKHPILTTLGGTALSMGAKEGVKNLFKKKASFSNTVVEDNFIKDYKKFLSNCDQNNLLESLTRIPKDLVEKICS